MKCSLRSLMLDAVLATPFLVFGAFAVYCARVALEEFEIILIYRHVVPAGEPQP
jgi:hypothetical protein